jgi:methylated-DNA-protein-cysteine methyltransferase-like protein
MPLVTGRRGRDGREAGAASSYARIYTVVASIPAGRVASYGQIAELAGLPRQARQVGYALSALPAGHALPWHRVINARGEISVRSRAAAAAEQRARLEAEGVAFDANGRVDLARYRWRP